MISSGRWSISKHQKFTSVLDVQDFDMSTLDWQNAFVTRVVRIRERPEPPTEEEQAGGLSPSDLRKLEASIQDGITEQSTKPSRTRWQQQHTVR